MAERHPLSATPSAHPSRGEEEHPHLASGLSDSGRDGAGCGQPDDALFWDMIASVDLLFHIRMDQDGCEPAGERDFCQHCGVLDVLGYGEPFVGGEWGGDVSRVYDEMSF